MSVIQEKALLQMDITESINKMEEERESYNEEIKEGYTIEKGLLLEAWARYRNEKIKMKKIQGKQAKEKTEVHNFDDDFIDMIIANIHLKVYDYSASHDEIKRKKDFKKDFVDKFKEKVKDKELEKKKEQLKEKDTARESEEEDDVFTNIPDEEKDLIDGFLKCFVLDSDSGSKVD